MMSEPEMRRMINNPHNDRCMANQQTQRKQSSNEIAGQTQLHTQAAGSVTHPDTPHVPHKEDLVTAEQQSPTLYLHNVQGISGDRKNTRMAASKRAELKQMLDGACDGQPHVVVLTDHKYAKT
jgi:hypothetical protein